MNDKLFYRGTIVEFVSTNAPNRSLEKYILAECHEDEKVFQIICISGYHAGSVEGFVDRDSSPLATNSKAVTYEHLISELKKNFEIVKMDSFKILN